MVNNGNNGFDKEIGSFGECFDTEDMKEGATAFLEKRKANFSGKYKLIQKTVPGKSG